MVNYSPTVWSGYNTLIKSPPEQPPLSSRNAYTTWPGGVDPTVPLYNTDNQKFGGARRRSRGSCKSRRASRKSRRASRRSRKIGGRRRNNKNNVRKSRKSRRSTRRYRGGYATCSPIDTTGSRANIPMSASVCPEGYFKTLDTLIL
jgi:hypothetical protein